MIKSLDSLRILGAMLVFLWHSTIPKFGGIHYGGAGVELFFILSGFCLTMRYSEGEVRIKDFMYKRIHKLYPLYIIQLLIAVFVMMIFWGEQPCTMIRNFVYNALCIQTLCPGLLYFNLSGIGWYVATTIWCYLFFSLTCRLVCNNLKIYILGGDFGSPMPIHAICSQRRSI